MQTGPDSKLRFLPLLALSVFAASGMSQANGVLGYWKEPQGSVIHVDHCGKDVCATLVAISKSAPSQVDGKNPKTGLRQRPLCGLRIGEGFHLTSPGKAEDGMLYDPKTGKTYHGTMTAHADKMDLRGYIGLSLFGRTERWTRTEQTAQCTGTAPKA
jgi:uncharacterized protein (DUF2147 family)